MNGGHVEATLVEATRMGGLKDVRFLLISAFIIDGEALTFACANHEARWPHLAITEALLESGAAFTQESLGNSLCSAAYYGRTACCELLLDHCADVHHHVDLPLCNAALQGHQNTAAFLLDNGANAWSARAMQWATNNRRDAIVALLLERRAA